MRLATYSGPRGERAAIVRDDQWYDVADASSELPSSVIALLALGREGLERAREAVERAQPLDRSGLKLRAPITSPEKIICIGLNYADHAAEGGQPIPDEPVVFNKFPTALAGPDDEIVLPPISQKVDYEAELVVVIGQGGRNIPEQSALDHVAGYTCGHDVSARDWQLEKPGNQWLLGKTFDTFAPIGPYLVTADEVPEPENLDIALRLNGETMQSSNTRHFIFSVRKLVSHVSQFATLKPGDLLFTGTPPGVGAARKPPVYLKAGDQVEVEIEKLGILRNRVVAG